MNTLYINHESSRKAFETVDAISSSQVGHWDINHESSRKAFETPSPATETCPGIRISITNLAERHLRLLPLSEIGIL